MKVSVVLLIVAVTLGISYASLWYGFVWGFEYSRGDNLAESIMTIHALKSLRSGKTQNAIYELEGILDTNIIKRSIGNDQFVKYLIRIPINSQETTEVLESQIIEYRKSSGYKCESAPKACEIVNKFLYGK